MTFILACQFCFSQTTIGDVTLKTLNGKSIRTTDLAKNEQPKVIIVWASCCLPCLEELDAISDVYQEWQENTNIKLYAVSVDDARNVSKVKSLVHGKGWDFEILLDTNGDLKRAMGITILPTNYIVKNNKILYSQLGYKPGSEDLLYEEIRKHSFVLHK